MAHCCRVECARDYSVAAINASASQWWLPPAEQRRAEHVSAAAAALAQCQGSAELLQSGGWCLGSGKRHRKRTPVPLANGQTYLLPGGHYAADDVVVAALDRLLRPAGGDGGGRYQSLLDLGAGVGQYGHQLPALDARHRYSGYDGAGDVENATSGFVAYADLSSAMRVPRADWVFSTEVGEHIPHGREYAFVSNLHAHACRGVVLSWELPSGPRGKITGHGHVNCHTQQYIARLMSELGYALDGALTSDLRGHGPHPPISRAVRRARAHLWLPAGWRENIYAYRRITPLGSC